MPTARQNIKRDNLIADLNRQIAEAPTVEKRLVLQVHFSSLLVHLETYLGFTYVEWLNGGFQRWHQDGCPENKLPYLGDQSMIRFI
jgi:hypothetical protein